MATQVATLGISFAKDKDQAVLAEGLYSIALRQTSERPDLLGRIYAECIARPTPTFMVTTGAVGIAATWTKAMVDRVKFSGSSTGSVSHPPLGGVTLTKILCLVRKTLKATKDQNGKTTAESAILAPGTDVTFTYDPETGLINAKNSRKNDVEVYGIVQANYETTVFQLWHTPHVDRIGGAFLVGVNITPGTIVAYNERSVEMLDMNIDVSSDKTEFARCYRKIVLTPDGAFESPRDWPEQTNMNGYELDPDNSFTDELPVCTCLINGYGALSYLRYHAPLLDETSPPYYWSVSRPPSVEWAELFLDVNEDRVETVFLSVARCAEEDLIREDRSPRPPK